MTWCKIDVGPEYITTDSRKVTCENCKAHLAGIPPPFYHVATRKLKEIRRARRMSKRSRSRA